MLHLTHFLLCGVVVTATSLLAINVAIQRYIDRKGDEISANPRDQLRVWWDSHVSHTWQLNDRLVSPLLD